MKTLAYAAFSSTTPLVPYEFERREPRENDVVIDILYCGVCHSDLHTINGDWNAKFPVVPGHEIIGKVAKIGDKVSKFKVGDFVGVGCMVDSCMDCEPCKAGLEQFCEEGNTQTYNGVDRIDGMPTQGGYSTNIVVREEFVLKIPSGMDLKSAAPVLCAGITTWSPLRRYGVKKGSKVAVVGLGGLGHMALKLANALGAEVTLFTRTPSKANEAVRLGAHKVVISTNADEMSAVRNKFDLIIDTVPYNHDVNPYVSTLHAFGTIVLVGYLGELSPTLNTSELVISAKNVTGSPIGGIKETQELLDFCGEHKIGADIEMINMQDINEAHKRMVRSDVKYRFVIDMKSLRKTKN